MSVCLSAACTEPESRPNEVAPDRPSTSTSVEPTAPCPPVVQDDGEPALTVVQELIHDATLVATETGTQALVVRLFSETQIQPPALLVDLQDAKMKKSILSGATAAVAKTYTVVSSDGYRFIDDWQGEVSAALLLPGAAKPQTFSVALEEGKVVSVQKGSVLRLKASSSGDKKLMDALTADPWLGATTGGSLTIQTPGGKPLTEPASVPISVTGRWLEWRLPVPENDAETVKLRVRVVDAGGKDIDGFAWEIAARLGSGTRTSAGQASNKAELL